MTATTEPGSDYMTLARQLSVQESRALRGWARAGTRLPQHRPVDRWDAHRRQLHTNIASFGAAA